MDNSYVCELSAVCANDEASDDEDTEDEGHTTLNVVVKFKNRKQYNNWDDSGFDWILEDLSEAIRKKYGKGWYVDDVVELYRDFTREEIEKENIKIDLDLTEKCN